MPYLLLWIGFAAGGVAAALVFSRLGLHALWIGCGVSALLLAGAGALGPLTIVPRT